MKILIVKLAALGDVLRTTSLLKPLKKRYPKAEIHWLTEPAALPLLEHNPYLKATATLSRPGRIGKAGYDLVLSLEENVRAARLAEKLCRGRFVGVYVERGRLRYTACSAPYYDLSLLNKDVDGGLKTANALKAANKETYAGIWLRILGITPLREPSWTRPVLALRQKDLRAARALGRRLGGHARPIGFNPGAGQRWPAKQLSCDKAARVLKALEIFRRPLVLLGGAQEAQRNAAIRAAYANLSAAGRLHDAGARNDLRQFAGIIALCELVVTADSLAFHIATALRKKVLVFIGPTAAAELDVFGRGSKLRPRPDCECFYRTRCARQVSCLDDLPEQRWVEAARRCLG